MADDTLENEALSLCGSLDALQMQYSHVARNDNAAGEQSGSKNKRSLLDLPAEVWSKIGKLVIDDLPHLMLCEENDSRNAPDIPPQPAITRTCRTLREELLSYYYSKAVSLNFSCMTPEWAKVGMKRTGTFLRSIGGPNRKHLSCAFLDLDNMNFSTKKWFEDRAIWIWNVPFEMVLVTPPAENGHASTNLEVMAAAWGAMSGKVYEIKFL